MIQMYEGQRLIKIATVERILGHKKTWIYNHIARGLIPQPVRLSSRSVVWDEADILKVKEMILAGTFYKT